MIVILVVAIVIHLSAFLLMVRGVEPISTYFYLFAWWTYIVFLSCMNHLRGQNSLLLDNPREFLWVFFYSTPVWLFFEIHNFWLNNWHYIGIPVETYVRWPGYVLAFGTVLPGIFETENFLRNFGVFTQVRGWTCPVTQRLLIRFVILGSLMMLLVPLRPDLFETRPLLSTGMAGMDFPPRSPDLPQRSATGLFAGPSPPWGVFSAGPASGRGNDVRVAVGILELLGLGKVGLYRLLPRIC